MILANALKPEFCSAMGLKPLIELGVNEAYHLAQDHFRSPELPPLAAIENEDWGRDYLLSRLLDLSDSELALAGLCREDPPAPVSPGDTTLASGS